jgi:hypothetical protein
MKGFDPLQPRFIRVMKAPGYLGMNRNYFNRVVRPYLTEIPISAQGVAVDRLELDGWAEDHKRRNGRPARLKGATTWDAREPRAFSAERGSGTSTSASAGGEFAKALAQLGSRKRKRTSRK